MKLNKLILTVLILTILLSQPVQAKCPPELDETGCKIWRQNNEFFVPEQWGFRSNMSVKDSYLMDMKPQWQATKDEWNNTYNPKPIHSNWKDAVTTPIIYSNQFKTFRIPKSWVDKF